MDLNHEMEDYVEVELFPSPCLTLYLDSLTDFLNC
jgi:hypothetical protein